MRTNRYAVVAVAGAAALLVGGGAALAGPSGDERSARCDARLARVAEHRGVSVAELEAQIKERMLARVAAALEAEKISPERAAKLRERIAAADLCERPRHGHVRAGLRGILGGAAHYLGLTKEELREQLPGTSLSALAAKQGKSVEGLKAAMIGAAKEKLAKAVAAGRITQARADQALERLAHRIDRLVSKTFPAKP